MVPPRNGSWTKISVPDGSVEDANDEIAAWAFVLVFEDREDHALAGSYSGKVSQTCKTLPSHALTSTDS
eukprot:684537-Pyramimonas_sp.AAC.1